MKIYCNRAWASDFDLDKYIGKDIWIHCLYCSEACWIKIINSGKDDDGYYIIADYTEDVLLKNEFLTFNSPYTLAHNEKIYLHHLSILTPIEVLTTQEMEQGDYEGSLLI